MAIPHGFADREDGNCSSTVNCGLSWGNYHWCCPKSSVCQTNDYDRVCCDSQDSFENCLDTLSPQPKCANSIWTLYDNAGYFCCKPGTIGYRVVPEKDIIRSICAPATGFTVENATILLPVSVSSGNSTDSTPPSSSHTHIPEIVGGVVGGIVGLAMLAGLAIFLIWRRKRAISNTIHHELPLQDDYHPAVELPVAEKQTELPSRREVVELHSTSLER